MVKFLFATSMILTVLAVTLLDSVESAPWDLMKMGQDAMKMGQSTMKMGAAAAEVMQKFNPEDIKEIMEAFKKPEERQAFMEVLAMIVQGKPMSEVADKLLDLECGPAIAGNLAGLMEPMADLKETYGEGLKNIADKGK